MLHITSGDIAGESLAKSGLPGEVMVWHDVMYDGSRNPGWPEDATLQARARFLEEMTGGGMQRDDILVELEEQYRKLAVAADYGKIVLWFDACLFDQSMLAHILVCLQHRHIHQVELLCVDAFPGIDPYNGLGQLSPAQLASVYDRRQPITDEQFRFAEVVDKAFANQDRGLFTQLTQQKNAPLPWVPAAVRRWLQEQPDPETGLGQLEQLALDAIRNGCKAPTEIFSFVAEADTPPQYWGDITLWAKINALAECIPPLVLIEGPLKRLPQWESDVEMNDFTIRCMSS